MSPQDNNDHSQPQTQPENHPQSHPQGHFESQPQNHSLDQTSRQSHNQPLQPVGNPSGQQATPVPPQHEQHHPDINSIYPSNPAPDTRSSQSFSPGSTPNNAGNATNFAQTPVQNTPTAFGPNQPQTTDPAPNSNAGLMVLQWLTYAFWGWTVLGLSVLTGLVVQSYMGEGGYYASAGSATLYSLAAVLVLLPVSFVCETLYSKREQAKKTGGPLAIMAIHAVIFALFGIGSLIVAAFSIVRMLTSNSSGNGSTVSLVTSLIIAVYYAVTFLRTLNFAAIPWFAKYYRFFMLITIGIMAVMGIVGPMAKERSTRNDRLIESNISSVSTAVNNYTTKNKSLPNKLSDLSLIGDAKKLVDDNLVEYKKDSTGTIDSSNNSLNSLTNKYSTSTYSVISLRYQLCVTYKQKSSYPTYGVDDVSNRYDTSDGYTSYLSTYGHKAGNICYKLKTSSY